MELHEIIEIKETTKTYEANNLLNDGWVLLSVGFVDEQAPGYQYHKYSLGLPESVKRRKEIKSALGL